MGGSDLDALCQAFLSDNRQNQHFSAVVQINLVAGFQLHAPHVGLEALFFSLADALGNTFPLGLPGVDECLVGAAVGLHSFPLLGGHTVIAVFLLGQ